MSGTNGAVRLQTPSNQFLQLTESTSSVDISVAGYLDIGNDLRIFTSNSGTTAMPFVRSDGNYLLVESRPTANGGFVGIGFDNNSTVDLGRGGGYVQLHRPYFMTNSPEWELALAQTTVGAAGSASALPALPTGYVKIKVNGSNFVIPVYNP